MMDGRKRLKVIIYSKTFEYLHFNIIILPHIQTIIYSIILLYYAIILNNKQWK